MRLIPAKWKKTVEKYRSRWAIGVVLSILAAATCMNLIEVDELKRLDTSISAWRMRLEKPVLDPRIVIVDIDGKSLTEVGRFPWSRNIQAKLVEQLTEHYKVGAVGFDISFPEADTSSGYGVLERLARTDLKDVPAFKDRVSELKQEMDYDGVFAQAMLGQPVVLGFSMSFDQKKGVLPKALFSMDDLNGRDVTAYNSPGYEANIAKLQRAAAGAGSFSVVTDSDGIVRTAALIQQIGDNFYPSLSIATAAVYLKATAIKPFLGETVDSLSAAQMAAGGYEYVSIYTGSAALGNSKQRKIPVSEGITTTISYRGMGGPSGGAFRYVSAVDVLKGTVPAKLLEGAVVLVGTTAPGLVDLRATPTNPEYPGVEIHANIIKSILDQRFKKRNYLAVPGEAGFTLLLGLVLSIVLAGMLPVYAVVTTVSLLGAMVWGDFYLYAEHDQLFNIGAPLILTFTLFLMNLAWGYFVEFRKGKALVNRFGEYVAPELVEVMADDPDKYNMDGESRELTVMFVDVRGFTTISEGLSPKALREYINLYLTAMSEDIRGAYRGTLDKYIGDAVMAFWGAPVPFEDHASRGVATSILMQASAKRLNEDFIARGWPELKIGIGVNSGVMHVGDMGSAIRKAYTVMGDAVNLGSRLEGITKVYGVGICVGEATRQAATDFVYRELDLVKVKGKNEPVAIFEPVGKVGAVDEATLAEIAAWQATLALIRSQAWDAAEASLHSLYAARPAGLYELYLERIAIYRQDPPGADWDGVTKFETK